MEAGYQSPTCPQHREDAQEAVVELKNEGRNDFSRNPFSWGAKSCDPCPILEGSGPHSTSLSSPLCPHDALLQSTPPLPSHVTLGRLINSQACCRDKKKCLSTVVSDSHRPQDLYPSWAALCVTKTSSGGWGRGEPKYLPNVRSSLRAGCACVFLYVYSSRRSG